MTLPRPLLRKSFLFGTIAFIVTFSALFLFIYRPYSDTLWFSFRDPQRVWPSLLYYLLSIGILCISKGIVLAVQKAKDIVIGRFYLITVILECLALTGLYVYFAVAVVTPPMELGFQLCARALFCIVSILAIPYLICVLVAAYNDKAEELAAMRANVERTMITSQFEELAPDFVDFRDSSGVLRISLDRKSIYYIESQDNYVNIFYEMDEQIESYLLRCKTSSVEEMLRDTGMVRCHRSYLVNPGHIMSVTSVSGGRARIRFDNEKVNDIPVSRTYAQAIREL